MAFPTIQPVIQYFDLSGEPLDSGYIYIGTANADPEDNPIDVFYDLDGTIPAAQPIRTVAGYPARFGSPTSIYSDAASYSIRVRNSSNGQVFYFAEVPTALVTASAFGATLIAATDATDAQQIMGVEVGVDVQPYDVDTPTIVASEASMRAGVQTLVRSMSAELVGFAIDELGTSVRVTDDDTTAGRLEDKIVAGDNITITVLNPGANEQLQIDANGKITKSTAINLAGESSGTFTDIPTGTVGIDVTYSNVGSMADDVRIKLGTDSGIVSTGYESSRANFNFVSTYSREYATDGFNIGGGVDVSGVHSGTLSLRRVSGNTWVASGCAANYGSQLVFFAGTITLPDLMSQLRIDTDTTFSGGLACIQYW